MFDWINDLWGWITALFQAGMDFLTDLPILVMSGVLDALATLIESISAPDFMSVPLGSYLAALPSGVLYFLDQSGLADGTALLVSAFLFRMARKAFTLFQW